MDTSLNKKSGKSAWALMMLCAVVYCLAYVGRLSYSANIVMIRDFFLIDKGTAGIVGTCLFISYGVGQVVNGLLCKRYNPKYAIAIGLAVSSLMNLAVGLTPSNSFYLVCVFWFFNGAGQSILFSSLIRLLNTSLAKKYVRTAVLALSIPGCIGTFIVYGLSAMFSALNISFQTVFYTSAAMLLAAAIVWFLIVNKLKEKCLEERAELDGEEPIVEEKSQKKKSVIPKGFFLLFSVFALFAIVNNFTKEGAITWMPTILKEKYALDESLSTFLTLFLPLFGVFGAIIAQRIHKKIGNYVWVCGILYGSATLFIGLVVILLDMPYWFITLSCFILVAVCMSGVNNLLTCIFPMTYSRTMNAGLLAGLIDAFCYVGSAITTYGLGAISDSFGSWDVVIYVLLGACALMMVICVIFNIARRNKD